jgi:hypothetical protein
MILSKSLLSEGGILSGDDLEKIDISDNKLHQRALKLNLDYLEDYHPGVTQAFLDEFGYQSEAILEGFWALRKENALFCPQSLDHNAELVVGLPPWIPVKEEDCRYLCEDPNKQLNYLLTAIGILEISQDVGPLDFHIIPPMEALNLAGVRLIMDRERLWQDFLNQAWK